MLNVNPFLHFMILVKIILDKSRAIPVWCCSNPAGRIRLHKLIKSLHSVRGKITFGQVFCFGSDGGDLNSLPFST